MCVSYFELHMRERGTEGERERAGEEADRKRRVAFLTYSTRMGGGRGGESGLRLLSKNVNAPVGT